MWTNLRPTSFLWNLVLELITTAIPITIAFGVRCSKVPYTIVVSQVGGSTLIYLQGCYETRSLKFSHQLDVFPGGKIDTSLKFLGGNKTVSFVLLRISWARRQISLGFLTAMFDFENYYFLAFYRGPHPSPSEGKNAKIPLERGNIIEMFGVLF